MQKRKMIVGSAAVVVVAAAWYLFRPELLFVNAQVNESFPGPAAGAMKTGTASQTVVASGNFHGVAHETKGMATVYDVGDGKRVLRLTDFETSNGPALHLYLVAADDANDNDTVKQAGHVELGSLKGNIGDQNYDLPGDIDLEKYRAVTIWCQRFGVNFGTAPLMSPGTSARPNAQPVALASGQFHKVAHDSKGTATIYEIGNGKRVLRFTDFETSNGPALHVYLVAAGDANDNETIKQAGFIELGSLKGNVGDQNYDVPADTDLSKYRAVTIWCQRFGVNFGTAPLEMQ
jgi:hypothetical protein